MRTIIISFYLFFSGLICTAQIRSLEGFKHTIEFLTENFRLDTFNTKCSTCNNCNEEFRKDSLIRSDSTSLNWYMGSRVLGSCFALKKLLYLFRLDLDLQAMANAMEHKYKTSDKLLNQTYTELNLKWYQSLDTRSNYYLFNSMKDRGGLLEEQIDLAIIMMSSRISELQAIDKLLSE